MGVLVILAAIIAIVALARRSANKREEEWEQKQEQEREKERAQQRSIRMSSFDEAAAQQGQGLLEDPQVKHALASITDLMGGTLGSHFYQYGTNILRIEVNSNYFTYQTDDGKMKPELERWDKYGIKVDWKNMTQLEALLWVLERLAAEGVFRIAPEVKTVYCEAEGISGASAYGRLVASKYGLR